jgi:hypothetical protein
MQPPLYISSEFIVCAMRDATRGFNHITSPGDPHDDSSRSRSPQRSTVEGEHFIHTQITRHHWTRPRAARVNLNIGRSCDYFV